jgi:hypothetical protein
MMTRMPEDQQLDLGDGYKPPPSTPESRADRQKWEATRSFEVKFAQPTAERLEVLAAGKDMPVESLIRAFVLRCAFGSDPQVAKLLAEM